MNNLSLIVAIAKNNAIGYKNKLLYWLPNDLKRFKKLTSGHTIIMGRKTFESLPKGALPNRRNIVLSTSSQLRLAGAEVYGSLEEALEHCSPDQEIFIIGGASLYHESLKMANKVYLTFIEHVPEQADAFFPVLDPQEWKETDREVHQPDDQHLYPYTFINYIRY